MMTVLSSLAHSCFKIIIIVHVACLLLTLKHVWSWSRSTIRDKIIPHAVSWFTGEAVQGEEFDDIDDDDDDDGDEEDDDEDEDEDNDEDEDDEDEDDDDEEEEEAEVIKSKKKVCCKWSNFFVLTFIL